MPELIGLIRWGYSLSFPVPFKSYDLLPLLILLWTNSVVSCCLFVEAAQRFMYLSSTAPPFFREQDRKQSPSFNTLKPSTGSQRCRGGCIGNPNHREAWMQHCSGDHFSCNDGENTEQLICSPTVHLFKCLVLSEFGSGVKTTKHHQVRLLLGIWLHTRVRFKSVI